MSRLIDADVIQNEDKQSREGRRLLLIDVAPTIDAVEVIRCKDCKYFENHCDCVKHSADILGYVIEVTDDDYCSYGERREE